MLRYREGGTDKVFVAPVTLMGRIVGTYAEVVRLEQARARIVDLYLEDLGPALGGADMVLGLMLDATDNDDRVKIVLAKDRITYENSAQLQRFREKEKATP